MSTNQQTKKYSNVIVGLRYLPPCKATVLQLKKMFQIVMDSVHVSTYFTYEDK